MKGFLKDKRVITSICVGALLLGCIGASHHKYNKQIVSLPNQDAESSVCGTSGGCEVNSDIEFGYQVGDYIPNMTLTDFDGNEVMLYDVIEGKDLVILNLGVEWCSDCQRDKAKMDQYYESLPDNVEIITVYMDFDKADDPEKQADYETAKTAASEHVMPAYWDENDQFKKAFDVKNTPTSVVIDGSGKIKAITAEYDTEILLQQNTDELILTTPTTEEEVR